MGFVLITLAHYVTASKSRRSESVEIPGRLLFRPQLELIFEKDKILHLIRVHIAAVVRTLLYNSERKGTAHV